MATKRNRADSAASAVKAMVNAAKDTIQVPAHVKLREGDVKRPGFHGGRLV